jgi:hypothetical protein
MIIHHYPMTMTGVDYGLNRIHFTFKISRLPFGLCDDLKSTTLNKTGCWANLAQHPAKSVNRICSTSRIRVPP